MSFIPFSGYAGEVLWAKETTFGTAVDGNRRFGVGQKLNTMTATRNYERVYTLGNRKMTHHIYREFKGSVGVGFYLSNPYIFNLVLKGAYDDTSNTTTFTPLDSLVSATIDVFYRKSESDATIYRLRSTGAVAGELELSVRAGGIVEGSVTFDVKNIESGTVSSIPSAMDDDKVVTFATTTVTIDGVEVYAEDFSVTIKNNPELLYVMGSDKAKTGILKALEVTGRITLLINDLAVAEKILNNQPITLSVTMNAVGTSGGEDTATQITMSFGSITKYESLAVPQSPNEPVVATIDFVSDDITVTVAGGNYVL